MLIFQIVPSLKTNHETKADADDEKKDDPKEGEVKVKKVIKKKGKGKKGKKTKASFSRGRGKSSMGRVSAEPADPEPMEEESDQLSGEDVAAPIPKLDQELIFFKTYVLWCFVKHVLPYKG